MAIIKVFLTHTGDDKDIIKYFADKITSITLGQIKFWYCTDTKIQGGFSVGDTWYHRILSEINQSDVVIAIVTPNSKLKPWLYFESGYGIAKNKTFFPVCLGMKKDELDSTLREFQSYQLTSYSDVVKLIGELFKLAKLEFLEEMHKVQLEEMIKKNSEFVFPESVKKNLDVQDFLNSFKDDFLESFSRIMHGSTKSVSPFLRKKELRFKLIHSGLDKKSRDFIIEIDEEDSFQSLTNQIFFNINDIVLPYTYLEKWIIVNPVNDLRFVIREVASEISAFNLFKSDITYEVQILERQYRAIDSRNRVGI